MHAAGGVALHELLPVGEVVRAHGIRGEVVVNSPGASLAGLQPGEAIWLGDPPAPHRVRQIRPHQGRLLLALEALTDRNGAEALRGATVWVHSDQRAELGDGEAWVEDLIGSRILDPQGQALGIVQEVLESPAQDLLRVSTSSGDALVPMVRDWLRRWDAEQRELVMDLPEGLLPHRDPPDRDED